MAKSQPVKQSHPRRSKDRDLPLPPGAQPDPRLKQSNYGKIKRGLAGLAAFDKIGKK
jgi:hypothetical protein